MLNLTRSSKFMRVANAAAAGQTAVTSSAVDTRGFRSCTFCVLFGAITASGVQSVKAQQSSDDGSADSYADLLGTSISVADDDDNQIVLLQVKNPRERYLKCVVSRATQNSAVDGIIAILDDPITMPVTHDATTVVTHEFHNAPAEGTA